MSFVWTEDISLKVRQFAANMNEAQDNIDTLYAALVLTRPGCGAGAGWTVFPITDGVDHILTTQPQQLRDAIDYAYENMCLAFDGIYQDGVDTTEETGYQNAHLEGYDLTYDYGYDANKYISDDGTDDDGYDADYFPGHDNFYDTGGE